MFSSPNANAVMSSVEKRFYGVASATLGTMRLTGQMLSMGIATLIVAVYMGNVQISPEYYPLFMKSANAVFTVFAGFCFVGVFMSLCEEKSKMTFDQKGAWRLWNSLMALSEGVTNRVGKLKRF